MKILGISAHYHDNATALLVNGEVWLSPVILILLLLGTLIVFGQGSAIAPFIHTLF